MHSIRPYKTQQEAEEAMEHASAEIEATMEKYGVIGFYKVNAFVAHARCNHIKLERTNFHLTQPLARTLKEGVE